MLPLRKYHLLLFNYMTMRQRTINNLIEISPQAEGSFLTQAFPTNFHQFYTKKLLTLQESVSDYKEVTAAEKANIINADSQWVEPNEELKATAKAVGADYNVKTGYFEYNTLTDITAEQMRLILRNTQRPPYNVFVGASIRNRLRTNLWEASGESSSDTPVDASQVFANWSNAEVLNLYNGYSTEFTTRINGYGIFKSCIKLHTILGEFRFVNNKTNAQTFYNCLSLRTFKLREVNYNIDLHWSPNIDFETLQFMVNNALDTNAKTITLHPDVYARLTEELIAQAAEKQITFATTS